MNHLNYGDHNSTGAATSAEQEVTKPTYFSLTFLRGYSAVRESIKVYIELKDIDRDLLYEAPPQEKSFAIARRVGILDYLPGDINADWPHSGMLVNHETKTSWDGGLEPTIIKEHNVWIIGDA